jgi:hypothetical protein
MRYRNAFEEIFKLITLLQKDMTTTLSLQKQIKSIDMRINWLKDRESQGQFQIYWDKGSHNLAVYRAKHHPPEYHIAHRQTHAG